MDGVGVGVFEEEGDEGGDAVEGEEEEGEEEEDEDGEGAAHCEGVRWLFRTTWILLEAVTTYVNNEA